MAILIKIAINNDMYRNNKSVHEQSQYTHTKKNPTNNTSTTKKEIQKERDKEK